MIAAAQADGQVDAEERARIQTGIRELGLDAETSRILEAEMEHGADPAEIAKGADSPETAAEIYLASRLAIELDTWQERAYLGELARELRLDPGLVDELEQQAQTAAG
jgi:uncharacterized membrane protein YebE (DUF533 family)